MKNHNPRNTLSSLERALVAFVGIILSLVFMIAGMFLVLALSLFYSEPCEIYLVDCYDEHNNKINELTCEEEECHTEMPMEIILILGVIIPVIAGFSTSYIIHKRADK